jgi:hypothetical protein
MTPHELLAAIGMVTGGLALLGMGAALLALAIQNKGR